MDPVPTNIQRWFEKIVEENLKEAKSEGAVRIILIKKEHTKKVVAWGKKIMDREKLDWNTAQGLAVCQLHDIGRFAQSHYQTFSDKLSIDHAQKGKDMFLASGVNLEEFNGNREIIAEAIEQHNNPSYEGNNIYAKLIRDADQLTIIEDVNQKIYKLKSSLSQNGTIDQEVLERFKQGQVLNTRKIKTVGEWLLALKSWENRFNFKATKEIYREERLAQKIQNKYQTEFPDHKQFFEYFNPGP